MEIRNNAIGGYFSLELPLREEYHKNAIRSNCGRNSLDRIPFMLLLIVALFCLGCSSENALEEITLPVSPDTVERKEVKIDCNDSLGRINAVKKAYQMIDIQFVPKNHIRANGNNVYNAGVTYKGLIYSSAKELETFIGNDVSIHTFMTAIHNPKSKIYTEDISKPPYHGLNCRSYYGTVCSSLVSHALGIVPRYWANDFPLSDVMREVDSSTPDSIQVADVLWKSGHVAMITAVSKDKNEKTEALEISESIEQGCRRYTVTRDKFIELMNTSFKKVFRYTELNKNTNYTPVPEFVAVLGEEPIQYVYNDDLCVDKGDRSCYLEDEEVVINAMHVYKYIEIYKDENLYETIGYSSEDLSLQTLPYGNYKARIFFDNHFSDYTYWKVVNVEVVPDRTNNRIYFHSANAIPQCVRYCDKHGDGGSLTTYNRHILSEIDKMKGYIDVLPNDIKESYPYIRVNFLTDYGRVINKPLNWFESE